MEQHAKMRQIRIITGAQVKQALPMPQAIAAMRRAFGQYSAGQASVPLRGRLTTDQGVLLLMPAYMQASGDLAVKLVSVCGANPRLGLPTVMASVLVLDSRTGRLQALMEGDALTALRTGAGGGLSLFVSAHLRCVGLFCGLVDFFLNPGIPSSWNCLIRRRRCRMLIPRFSASFSLRMLFFEDTALITA